MKKEEENWVNAIQENNSTVSTVPFYTFTTNIYTAC